MPAERDETLPGGPHLAEPLVAARPEVPLQRAEPQVSARSEQLLDPRRPERPLERIE